MQNLFTRFIEDESGATAIEYGLIAALISIALVVGAQRIGTAVSNNFENVATAMGN